MKPKRSSSAAQPACWVIITMATALFAATDFGAPEARSPGASKHVRTLSFAERVAHQYAVEEVYWRHRIWPKENPGPKPSLDAVMSQEQIEQKVEEYLRNSQLLADQLQKPITREQLQAEMDRMAKHTRQREVLRELFAACTDLIKRVI